MSSEECFFCQGNEECLKTENPKGLFGSKKSKGGEGKGREEEGRENLTLFWML